MKKKLLSLVLMLSLVLALPMSASAMTLKNDKDMSVTYTGSEFECSFKSDDIAGRVRELQGGDDAVFTINLKNAHTKDAEWYMKNEVTLNMERNAQATNAAYGYRLAYKDENGEETLIYESATVGGTGSGGLKDATDATKEYFHLARIGAGKSGTLELRIHANGETLTNAYQGKFAELTMQFAAEEAVTDKQVTENKTVKGEPSKRVKTVKTGDDSNIILYVSMAAFALGLVLLLLAFRKKRDEEEQRVTVDNRRVKRGRREDR